MEIWVGLDSTGAPDWHTTAETPEDCRELCKASYVNEGDRLLVPVMVWISWSVMDPAGQKARQV